MTPDWPRKLFGNRGIDSEVAFGGAGPQTVGELAGLATRVAYELRGLATDCTTLVACRDRFFFAAAAVGSWMAGHPVTLPPNTQDATVNGIRDAEPGSIVLHDTDSTGGIDLRSLDFDQLDPRQGLTLNDNVRLARVLTSGSTATPVPHWKTASQLLGEAHVLAKHFDLHDRRIVACVPAHHLYGLLFGVLAPIIGGGSFSRSSPLQPRSVVQCLTDKRASVLVSVPPQLAAISKTLGLEFPPMHAIFSSGGPLDETVANALSDRWHGVTEILGSTETGGIGYRFAPTGAWTPLPEVAVVQGEGDQLLLARGFFDPGHDGPYPCEDSGRVHPDRTFDFLGRRDGVVKVGGRRTHVGHVASVLRELDGVDDASVVSRPGRAGRGAELWALVSSSVLDARDIRAELAQHLDPVVVPKRIRVTSMPLPRNEMGKTTAAMLIAAMEERVTEIQFEDAGPDAIIATIRPDSVFFRGHFPGDPVLPGAVQIDRLVLPYARANWPDLGGVRAIRRIKFKKPITPEQRLRINVHRDGTQVRFRISWEAGRDLVFSEGTLVLEKVER